MKNNFLAIKYTLLIAIVSVSLVFIIATGGSDSNNKAGRSENNGGNTSNMIDDISVEDNERTTFSPEGAIWKQERIFRQNSPEGFGVVLGWLQVATLRQNLSPDEIALITVDYMKLIEIDPVSGAKTVFEENYNGDDAVRSLLCIEGGICEGGLYERNPSWFFTDDHQPFENSKIANGTLTVDMSKTPDRIAHWWTARIPQKETSSYMFEARVKISGQVAMQFGADYWTSSESPYNGYDENCAASNNCAGWVSNWFGDSGGEFITIRSPQAFQTCTSVSGNTGMTLEGINEENPDILLYIDFDNREPGKYDGAALCRDWDCPDWSNGINENRVSVVEDNGNRALKILYPARKFGPENSGAQWKYKFPSQNELYLSYRVKFVGEFQFIKGGKLPGLAGGSAPSGGITPSGHDGWSGRIMWRDIEIGQYVYYPEQSQNPPYGDFFGYSVDAGQCLLLPDEWMLIENRVVMNTSSNHDGIIQAWINGQPVLDKKNLKFREADSLAIDLLYFSSFFGGADSSWAPTTDQYILFDDFVISTKPLNPYRATAND